MNKSSVGIDVDMEVALAGTNSEFVNLASTRETVASTTSAAGLYLEITPISGAAITNVTTKAALEDVTPGAYSLSGASIDLASSTTVTGTAVTVTGTAVSGNAIEASLTGMPEAYKVASDGAVTLDESVASTSLSDHAYTFAITGYADPSSSVWKDMDKGNKNLSLTMKFTIKKVGDSTPRTPAQVVKYDAGYAYIGITSTGGFSTISDVSDTKINGSSVTTHNEIYKNCLLLTPNTWKTGDVFTFTNAGVNYTVTLQ